MTSANSPGELGRETIRVTTPSRIHFGLLSVGQNLPVNFGGCGVMVREPRLVLELNWGTDADVCFGDNTQANRISEIIQTCRHAFRDLHDPPLRCRPVSVHVESMPPCHSGFGTGTQLALALAVGLQELWGVSRMNPAELALMLRRGSRSAIGTFGFFSGGFLVDRGVDQGETVSRLNLRTDFPDWPIVLIEFPKSSGMHGLEELKAFDKIVSTTSQERLEMEELLNGIIVPAVYAQDYSSFAGGIREYGRRSGDYYHEFQQGTFHSPLVNDVVEALEKAGWVGNVQSSWGPTLASFAREYEEADQICDLIQSQFSGQVTTRITRADNHGAEVTRATIAS